MRKIPLLLTVALAGLLAFSASCAKKAAPEVYFYNWTEYLPQAVLDQFTKETGIKVVYTTYDSNEAMYAKLKLLGGKGGYDLVVPSTYFVSRMAKEGMLEPLDRILLSNFHNLDPKVLDKAYDPGNHYSIPYLWGVTGLAVDSKVIDPAKVTGWADLWKPEFKGKVLLHNDPREVFHLALRTLDYPGNSTDPAQLEKAYQKLQTLMPSVKVFNSDSPKVPYLAGEVSVGMIWNGEAYAAQEEKPELTFVYPREGAIIWVDSLVIPKGAKHVKEAHALIDFLLRPEIAKAISEEVGYASPNAEALKLMDAQVSGDRTVYPSPEDLVGAEVQVDIGDAVTMYESYWEKLKAGR